MAAEMFCLIKCRIPCVRTCAVSLMSHSVFMVWIRYLLYRGESEIQRVK